jgi:ribonuclease VapC
MVIDASALVAILVGEPEGADFIASLGRSSTTSLSPVGYWEAAVNMRRHRGEVGVHDLERLLTLFQIRQAPITAVTAILAFSAHKQFGRGTPAKLNLGDCFAYALARELNAPLLYKGDDFARTDIQAATTA